MSVYIRLIRNNIKSSSSYGKYFAKAVSQGEVTLDEIAAEACRNSGFSEGSVIGVATEIQDIMKQRLREGRSNSTSGATSPASSAVSSLPAAVSLEAEFSTTSATG